MSSGICAKCAKPFSAGSILNALDKRWHPECFVCAGCKHQLANQSFHCKDEVPYCVNCWKEKFQPRCSSCGVIIDPSEQYVLYDDKAYHKGCFRCSQCQTPLNGKQFCIVNGQYLCPEHVQ
ncbi:Four and a half LIM domains protein 3 [Echinococcus multilocularis]|uniref:Four and a half LIM domains protein 3 n=2 Tax=Echinococcus TaxID=6209 RepID=U6JBL7_ECHGR|nr:Four and a half LIM domains-containing protein [Echinococcus granulosus]EUB61178.1 Four and a half LIM domains-containing protein [Echinococcus granulosus]CDI98160.1 Four and a half LIM domains protein 3 [Echinococcus multilocularis]CDS19823.1 Four and a half LIM domains protein 3 [Echinococcus granulosus]